MYRGFYTVASGMIAQQRRTEMLTNNMANVNTPGFKAEQSSIRSFPEMFLSSIEKTNIPTEKGLNFRGVRPLGQISTGVYMQETLPLFTQGSLIHTELPTDLALIDGTLPVDEDSGVAGAVFFTLENGDGQLYTKNGNFALSPEGFLTNPLGYYVLDTAGNRIQLTTDNFTVSEDGVVLENGEQAVATIGIAFSQRPDTLLKRDNGLFATEDGENLQQAAGTTYTLQQGYVEGSNVDTGRTMTDMMTAYRAFEANQKVLQAYDRSMEKSVEIGRLN